MNKIAIKIAKLNRITDEVYVAEVNKLIRKKYSMSAELAILRQRDAKPEEFAEYNAYAEECKARARTELGIGG